MWLRGYGATRLSCYAASRVAPWPRSHVVTDSGCVLGWQGILQLSQIPNNSIEKRVDFLLDDFYSKVTHMKLQ